MKYVNYAHRGASSCEPENTLKAFYKGLDMKANGIETDIQLSKDGVAFLCHDDIFGRAVQASGCPGDYNWSELKNFTVICPEHPEQKDTLCSFEDFLIHFGFRDLTFAIELKGDGTAAETARLLRKYDLCSKTIVTSFKYEELAAFAKEAPEFRLGWLKDDFSDEEALDFKALGGWQLCPRASCITAEKVKHFNELGFTVRAWGIADEELMKHAYLCGTDGQTVNFPDKLTAYLESL